MCSISPHRRILLIFILCLGVSNLTAQNKYIDSLRKWLLEHPEPDTLRVMTTHRLSYRFSEIDVSKAWTYALETRDLAKKLGFAKGICLANINFALLESYQGNYKSSSEYYVKAIEIADSIHYTRGLSISYNNLADDYADMLDFPSAIEYSKKALALNQEISETRGQAVNLEQLGAIYFQKKDYDSARYYWQKAYRIADTSYDRNLLAQIHIDLGKYYTKRSELTSALFHLKKADSICTSTGEILSLILTYKAYSEVYGQMKHHQDAIQILKKALVATDSITNHTEEAEIYNLLSYQYESMGQYDSGIYFLRKHKVMSDSILSDKNFAHLAFLQTKHETELKEKENQQLKVIQKSQVKTIGQQNKLLLLTTSSLAFALLSIFFIYRSYQNKKKNAELEERNKLAQYRQEIAELEVRSLRAQMNPHFLFNSLNSIRNYIIKNEAQVASNYLADFANLMRKILDASSQSKITLEEELQMMKLYLNLELMRFSGGFQYTFNVAEGIDASDLQIPPMIIQPFAENAIWHGLLTKEEGQGLLNFSFFMNEENEEELICEAVDNGIGRKKSAELQSGIKRHTSKGIGITKERLAQLSGHQEPVQYIDLYDSDGKAIGTKVRIFLPIL